MGDCDFEREEERFVPLLRIVRVFYVCVVLQLFRESGVVVVVVVVVLICFCVVVVC